MAALLGAGTFAVHQLRFTLAGTVESPGGHGYLVPLGPVIALGLLLAFAGALARVARAAPDPAPRLRRLWPGASVSLFAVYCVQEAIEGLLTTGHPAGLAHGGWIALPLAIVIGLGIALAMRGAAEAARLVEGRAPWLPPAAPAPVRAVPAPWSPPCLRGINRHLAARGPPLASV